MVSYQLRLRKNEHISCRICWWPVYSQPTVAGLLTQGHQRAPPEIPVKSAHRPPFRKCALDLVPPCFCWILVPINPFVAGCTLLGANCVSRPLCTRKPPTNETKLWNFACIILTRRERGNTSSGYHTKIQGIHWQIVAGVEGVRTHFFPDQQPPAADGELLFL